MRPSRRFSLPDGSVCRIEPGAYRLVSLMRVVDGEMVWGQVFTTGPEEEGCALAYRVVEQMKADPGAFVRWWNVRTGAVQ